MKFFRYLIVVSSFFFLAGCGSYFNQPTGFQEARFGEFTSVTQNLKSLPDPEKKVVIGVYNFKDQTGQYKQSEVGSNFSTAVTQGATTILIKALEDSKWFRPIERENLANLLQERKIIEATRNDYTSDKSKVQRLDPLLFAGVILEGGIISYDSNILTGGVGARYFGAGGSTQYRQDRITIYLRAVATSTGEIVKTVYVSKTILSQGIDAGLFRFVNFQRLLEVETGYTKNEPAELAVKEAIEKAVENLIYEGIKDKLWIAAGGEDVNKEIVDKYEQLKLEEESVGLYERSQRKPMKFSGEASAGLAYVDGDYSTREPDFSSTLGLKYHFERNWRLQTEVSLFRLFSAPDIKHWWLSGDLNLEYRILDKDKFSPFVFGGPGIAYFVDDSPSNFLQRWDSFFKLQYGAGIEYQFSDRLNWFAKAKFNLTLSDKIDNIELGVRNDYFYNFSVGINYDLGF